MKNKIKQLRSYLTIEAEVDTLGYDFSLANEIYMNLFQEPFSSIKKNSTIILYGNEMNGFPMSSLTRNTPENKTGGEEERNLP